MAQHPVFSPEDLARLRELEDSYLSHDDPMRQSGHGGGSARWRKKRGIVLAAVERDGTFLDVGCANGYLLETLVAWAAERGVRLTPYGVDIGERLVRLAQRRLPQWAAHFYAGNIWDWAPPRRFDYVSTSLCVPEPYKKPLFDKLVTRIVAPGGRLILRAYFNQGDDGSRPEYFDNAAFLREQGITPLGSIASDPPGAEYVWIDCSV